MASILREVEAWLTERGDLMWEEGELETSRIAAEVASGEFFFAEQAGEAIGVVRFQLQDLLFWPDVEQFDSAFVHRLAVRRAHAGRGASQALLQWAVDRTRSLRRRWLRLDCDHTRTKLRAIYEGFGFRLHSYRQVGPYYVARYECQVE